MLAARIAVFALGVGVVGWTILSAIRTVILPRAAQVLITRWVFRALGVVFRVIANERRTYTARDRVMALYAPIGLVVLPGAWLALVTFGFSLIYWGLDGGSFGDAVGFSGSSITTLGFVPEASPADRIPAFTEAGLGLFLAALMVAYLPSLYAAFARREAEVSLLEVRAGGPPTAVEFLERQQRIGELDRLTDTWVAWERWFADIEESHTSYPALAFFRSPQPERSWVVAAGAVPSTRRRCSWRVSATPPSGRQGCASGPGIWRCGASQPCSASSTTPTRCRRIRFRSLVPSSTKPGAGSMQAESPSSPTATRHGVPLPDGG